MTLLPASATRALILIISCTLAIFSGRAFALATSPSASVQPGPLNIHVTAVRGGSQYRVPGETKWEKLAEGQDFTEGVEFRTGPRGTIQFTIGSDQVCRVDRLSVVKVLRANVQPDGTIKTDMGMTYGRVSKDVDQPIRPHSDTIVTPSSTLAVRGTEVAMFDSPPYAPEATSLTGAAIYSNHLKGVSTPFGAHGEGTASVSGNNTSATQTQFNNTIVPPVPFGQTATDFQQNANLGGKIFGPPTGAPQNQPANAGQQITSGMQSIMQTMGGSSTAVGGTLDLNITWFSSTPQTIVDLTVTTPLGGAVSAGQNGASGVYFGSKTASAVADSNGNYDGGEGFIFSNQLGTTFSSGTYKLTETFEPNGSPSTVVTTQVIGAQILPSGSDSSGNSTFSSPVSLTATAPSASFTIATPITSNEQVIQISGSGSGSGSGSTGLGAIDSPAFKSQTTNLTAHYQSASFSPQPPPQRSRSGR